MDTFTTARLSLGSTTIAYSLIGATSVIYVVDMAFLLSVSGGGRLVDLQNVGKNQRPYIWVKPEPEARIVV